MTSEEILRYQELIRKIPVTDNVLEYVVSLVNKTRPSSEKGNTNMKQYIEWGARSRKHLNICY